MSQSRFSIVLVGVSALLRRPLVSRLRPADGERSPWVVFTARVGRFDSGFRLPLRRFPSAGWPSGSLLPLFGTRRFGDCPRRVGLRTHGFRFSARTDSGLPLGGLAFGFTASAFRHAPLRRLPLGELAFGLTASDFRHAPIRSGRWAVGLRAYCFGDCHLAGWPLGSPLRKFRSAGWPSGSLLPLFGMRRFGVAAGRVRSSAFRFGVAARRVGLRASASAFRHAPLRGCPRRAGSSTRRVGFSAFRFGNCPRRVGLRVHCFRFSARAASEWLLGELVLLPFASEMAAGRVGLRAHCFRFSARTVSEITAGRVAFGLTASAFGMHRFGVAAGRVALRAHCFRFSARTDSEIALGGLVLPPSASEIALGGLAFGLTASAFRHALLRSGRWASSFFRLPLRSCRSAGWPLDSLLPLFGLRRFGVAVRRVGLRAHCFRFSARADSGLPSASWFFRSAGWPSGSLLLLFGMYRSALPHRRSEDRRSTTTRHLFHFKTLIPTC